MGSAIMMPTSEAGTAKLDDHHAVEGADEQHQRHADGDLKERKAQQAGERQILGGDIGKGQEARPDAADGSEREFAVADHARVTRFRLSNGRA